LAVLRAPATDGIGLPETVPDRLESYEHFQNFLFERTARGVKLGLDNTLGMLERLGHPEASLTAFHVAGTNGKGSTSAVLCSILRAAGLKTGLYTSPHLVDYRERIRVDGGSCSADELMAACERMLPHLREFPLTFFEITTLLALLIFLDRGVDVAVMEVGLGGRLDATNVLSLPFPVITDVQFDHERILGNRLREIAAEKAGIIRGPRPVVTGGRRRAVLDVLEARSRSVGASLSVLKNEARWNIRRMSWEGTRFRLQTPERVYDDLFLPLPGEHQVANAALAVRAVEVMSRTLDLGIGNEAVVQGLARVFWPGRLQVLRRNPRLVLDAAHNPGGARALGKTLRKLCPGCRRVLVLGMLEDKRHAPVIRTLAPGADEIVVTSPATARGASVEVLAGTVRDLGFECRAIPSVSSAVNAGMEAAGPDGIVCVTGSCYTVGEVLEQMGIRDPFQRPKGGE